MRRSEVKWNIAFFLTKRQGAFCEGVSLRTVCDKQNKECKKLVTAQPPKLLASPIYMQSHNHNNYDGFHLKMFQYLSKHNHCLLGTQHNRLSLVICAKPDLVDMFQNGGRQLAYILASK